MFLGDSLGYSDVKALGFDEFIILGFTDSKLIGAILLNVDLIVPGIDGGTELRSLDRSFDCSNDFNIGGLLLVGSM